jgi:hypothetical protein
MMKSRNLRRIKSEENFREHEEQAEVIDKPEVTAKRKYIPQGAKPLFGGINLFGEKSSQREHKERDEDALKVDFDEGPSMTHVIRSETKDRAKPPLDDHQQGPQNRKCSLKMKMMVRVPQLPTSLRLTH